MWTMSARQLANLRTRIRAYNRTVEQWRESGIYATVPLPTTVENEMRYISDKRSYTERMEQLGRALKSKNKHAADIVVYKGYDLPSYMVKEVQNIVRQKNKEKAEMRKQLFVDWKYISPVKKASLLANKNLRNIEADDYLSDVSGDYEDILEEAYPNMPAKAEIYINVWEDNGGAEDVPEIIRYLAENDPEGFKILMESPDIEKDIEYVYPDSVGASFSAMHNYTYKRGSAYKQSKDNRYDKAADYWREMYMDYQNREGYFAR